MHNYNFGKGISGCGICTMGYEYNYGMTCIRLIIREVDSVIRNMKCMRNLLVILLDVKILEELL